MKNKLLAILLLQIIFVLPAGELVEWKCDDGVGSKIVKSLNGDEFTGKIMKPEKLIWAQADDRGFFLNLSGASVIVAHSEKLTYPDGFILDAEFACDFSAAPTQPWFGLISKGKDYSSGYAVLINRNGSLCLSVKLEEGTIWHQQQIQIQNKRDHKLKIAIGEGLTKIWLDGKFMGERRYSGRLADTEAPFFISAGYYPFFGNIYHVKLQTYSAELLPKQEVQPEEKKPSRLADPPGTIIVNDFSRFTPKPHEVKSRAAALWSFRTNFKLRQSLGVLHPPALTLEDLVYDPKLNGRYDVVLVGRSISSPTKLQFKLGESAEYYRIALSESGDIHKDVDILIERNIDMTGKKISIASGNHFYLGCFKFIPASLNHPLEQDAVTVQVDKGQRWGDETVQDEINAKIASGYFVERRHIESRQEPAPGAEAQQRGFLLFGWNYLRHLFPHSVPDTDTGTPTLKISAAAGEYEPLTLALRGIRDVGEIHAVLTGFPEFIQGNIGVVRNIPKRTTNYQGKSEFMLAPQYIENSSKLAVKQGESSLFWCTLRALPGTSGGIYQGFVELQGSFGTAKVPVEFKVHAFDLDPVKGYDIGFHYAAINAETIRQDLRDMAAHGITSLWVHSEALLNFTDERPATINFSSSPISALCEEFKTLGMTGNLNLYADAFNVQSAHYPEDRDKAYALLIKQLEEHAKENKWPEISYTSWDEVLSYPHRLSSFQWEIKLLKTLGVSTWANHLWYKTPRPYERELAEIVPYVDVFVLRYNNRSLYYVDSWETIQEEAEKRGKKLHDYSPHAALMFAQPAAMRFNGGWFFRSAGNKTTGKCFYTYRQFKGSPFTDLDGIDWVYNFPACEQSQGGFSIDYECFREGIDDLRYILTLENLIHAADKRSMDTTPAKELLAKLYKSFDLDLFREKSLFVSSHWDRNWEDASGKRFASGDFNLPNGWSLENYDLVRSKLVDSISKLQEKLQ